VTDYLFVGSKRADLIEKYKLLQKQRLLKILKEAKKPSVNGEPSRRPVVTKVNMHVSIM